MRNRKELKHNGKKTVRRHYRLLVVVCLLAAFLGAEFATVSLSQEPVSGGIASVNGGGHFSVMSRVYDELATGNVESGESLAETSLAQRQNHDRSAILGGSRGVLSSVVNSVTSGSLLVKGYVAVGNILDSENFASILLIALSLLASALIVIFVQSVYIVISRRIFLEGRTYEKISIDKFLFLLRQRRWMRTGLNMLVLSIYHGLWWLTVAGGIIKTYSYFLVPYLLAENPDLTANEAITLSRRLMDGHKWECFKLQVSFILWWLFGIFTLGIASALFINPYKTAVYCEYYAAIREEAIEKKIEGVEKLNDRYLYEKPTREVLEEAYGDVLNILAKPLPAEDLRGVQGFLSRWFGIVLYNSKAETAYEQALANRTRMEKWEKTLCGDVYPERLFPLKTNRKREHLETTRYARNYSLASLIMLFFAFSFIGWLWEVSLHLVNDGIFVNRGVMHGPWLPIYGSGGVMILMLLKRFRAKPAVEFITTVVLCGCVEYFTSWYLEMNHGGIKWWDYTGYFLNLNGRICAEGLMVFGLGGMLIVYVAAPLFDNLFRKINSKILVPICIILIVIFVADQVYSQKVPNTGTGITDYAFVTEQVETADLSRYLMQDETSCSESTETDRSKDE